MSNFQINDDDVEIWTNTFNIDCKTLKHLKHKLTYSLKQTTDLLNDEIVMIEKWIKWLAKPFNEIETIFFNFVKILILCYYDCYKLYLRK